jgi:hypothetical protein
MMMRGYILYCITSQPGNKYLETEEILTFKEILDMGI